VAESYKNEQTDKSRILMNKEELILKRLFEEWAKEAPLSIMALPGSGSYRRYFRIKGKLNSAMGVYNSDTKENLAFLSFTKSFHDAGFPVPDVYSVDPGNNAYLLKDLGDVTLFSLIEDNRKDGPELASGIIDKYCEVVRWLPRFQVGGASLIDYSLCYPRAAFDLQSMMWDLNYFKYYFLKLVKVPFDEQKLEDDFVSLAGYLLRADGNYFMYRDFQSRNIMLTEGRPWFIDYQGGRKGPLQYDIASLLYDAKAAIPDEVRDKLLEEYLDALEKQVLVDRKEFVTYYYGFVLIRILQALGAYGFRGYYENKPHFLKSIPFAIQNLKSLLDRELIPPGLPMLKSVLTDMVANPGFVNPVTVPGNLTVHIFSFSYRKSFPQDPGGNGGGFIFDCRALPNPGKFEQFKSITGKDQPVIDFLRSEPAVDEFLNHVFALVGQSVKRYIERDFHNLMVGFGCTGGQHRSVYCAGELAKHLESKFPVKVKLVHGEIGG
jgi:aminoglycoside/choline kinase family phosphotransferase